MICAISFPNWIDFSLPPSEIVRTPPAPCQSTPGDCDGCQSGAWSDFDSGVSSIYCPQIKRADPAGPHEVMPKSSTSLPRSGSLDFSSLATDYARGRTLKDVVDDVLARIAAHNDPAIWTLLYPPSEVLAQVEQVEQRRRSGVPQPLYGLTFAVKDNIDVAGHPTTAACPAYAYMPQKSAPAVQRACDAGAIMVGKTNLDQFASGLVGVRSPYGIPRNLFDGKYISGGSSSGSAVAVAAGLVSFALGTDTAGSGRVPAAFNNIVGLKPTRGIISTSGVVPACRSLDCVSVFALTCDDAAAVVRAIGAFDPDDIASRRPDEFANVAQVDPTSFRFGVPAGEHLKFFGNSAAAAIYYAAIDRLKSLGGVAIEIDFSPFLGAGKLLYQGPWVAERLEATADLLAKDPEAILPVTRMILTGATRFTAIDALTAVRQLRAFSRAAGKEWAKMDVLALPTTGTTYTIAEVEADPLALNANLGYYTHFTNLLDMCAISVPSGFGPGNQPTGLMLLGQTGTDASVVAVASRFQRSGAIKLGATNNSQPPSPSPTSVSPTPMESGVKLAVVGGHLSGQPLNHQLSSRNARLIRSCRTAGRYRLYALAGTVPPKPGLLRTTDKNDGTSIEVEVWEMTVAHFGSFVASIPPPMGIGNLELEDGTVVKGFICEPYAISGARDISQFGGWRQYLQAERQDEAAAAK